ncbi:MAG: hypothetical protein IJJ69_08540 [Oscillospiraceae bacterium]|nr:hypothetical protein [Oscillospiraceae bacterium]
MPEQEIVRFANDTKAASKTLYNNGILARSEEEAQILSMYRELNEINKISIFSRIEGMLEAQTYQMSDK